jgi:hypothetical protein
MSLRFVGLVTLALMGAVPASAEGLTLLGGGELDLRFPQEGSTQELTAYLEVERAGFYAGFEGLVANDSAATEVSLYAGYRQDLATGFSYDLFYTRYFHPNDGGDCCGEIGLSLGVAVGERLELLTDLTIDPDTSLGSVEVGAEQQLTDQLALSANFGLFQQEEEPDERTWDLGVIYALDDTAAVEFRYYDSSAEETGYFGLLLTFDTEILGN